MSIVTIETTTGMGHSAAPKSKLENENGKDFILFDTSWCSLQSFIKSCLKMPITTDDFSAIYGSFSDESLIENCVTAMQAVQALGTQMGDPTELRKKIESDPNYLSSSTPPKEILGHCAWLAAQLSTQASTFHDSYNALKPLYSGTPKENKQFLDGLVTGPGGLKTTADTALKQVRALQKKLGSFHQAFTAAKTGISQYVGADSKVIAAAKAAENVDTNKIASLQSEANAAHKAWEDYTIAATTTTIGLAVLSLGLALPIATTVDSVLGKLAKAEMDAYNNYMSEIGTEHVELSQKTRLVLDLTSFNTMINNAHSYISAFSSALSAIEGVWLSQNTQLTAIANLSVKKIGTYLGVEREVHISTAMQEWKSIAQNTEEFVTLSMVKFSDLQKYPNQYTS